MSLLQPVSARADSARRRVLTMSWVIASISAVALPAAAQSFSPPVDTFNSAGVEISVSPVQQMSIVAHDLP
ncbi:hypothetical protein ABIB57_003486 [Devosia sp. UYZn731]|uniref:hypothetical protein n=1 Tax=Devosia sp. UYZn731 TaxID=3156345 RepID=UPI00339AE843